MTNKVEQPTGVLVTGTPSPKVDLGPIVAHLQFVRAKALRESKETGADNLEDRQQRADQALAQEEKKKGKYKPEAIQALSKSSCKV